MRRLVVGLPLEGRLPGGDGFVGPIVSRVENRELGQHLGRTRVELRSLPVRLNRAVEVAFFSEMPALQEQSIGPGLGLDGGLICGWLGRDRANGQDDHSCDGGAEEIMTHVTLDCSTGSLQRQDGR